MEDTAPYVPVKHPYVGNVRWAFMRWADISDAYDKQRTYLRRLRVLQTPLFAIYLHFIYLPDSDRDPHDHPCNFWSLILRGGYTEKVYEHVKWHSFYNVIQKRRIGSLHYMPVSSAHLITELKPNTITLCFFGRRQCRWGFWTPSGYVPFEDYEKAGWAPDPFGS